ncbi:MAG: S8 family serine peptidase [Acidobacteriota bacterium]
MNRSFPRIRFAFVILSVALLIAIYLGTGERRNSAQQRPAAEPTPKAKFEQFSTSDDVTKDIRSRSKEIVRVQFRSINDRDKAEKYGRIVGDFGSFVVLAKNKSTDMSRSGLEVQKIETSINLPGAKFEPVESTPAETIGVGDAAPNESGYYVVQFGGIAKDEWLDSIRDAGVEVLQYVPHQAFFVYGGGEAISKIAGHSRVRWVGKYTADQKRSPELARFVEDAKGDSAMFDVAVFGRANLQGVASSIPGRIIAQSMLTNNFFNVLRIEILKADLVRVAEISDVFRIDPYVQPVKEDERAAQIVAGNYLSTTSISPPGYNPLSQFGVDGTGVTVAVADDGISIPGNGGFYITSANTVHGPLRGAAASATGGHGHLNAGIIAGDAPFGVLDPTGYNYGKGIAPKANIINIPFLVSGNTTTDAQSIDDTLNTLGPNGVRGTISNNSWGAGTNSNSYDSLAAQYDGLVQDGSIGPTIDPFNIIFSAGNSGASGLTRPKVAKNVIAVGNTENLRTELAPTSSNNIDDLLSTSSRGPAADGRVKPDICAPGNIITGGGAGTGTSTFGFIPGDPNHVYSGGTSHAAPQVAGAAALFTQFWKNGHVGVNPSPALIKAAIINTAQEMNGVNTAAAIPNGNEGWGRINMKYMLNTGVPSLYVNQEIIFSDPGMGLGMIGTVADPTKPVRITLVWTDPPGAGNPALVNNLDLQVNVGGTFYRGNVFSGGVSVPGGSGDTVNNVENVFLPAGIPAGTFFSVAVSSVALNGNGVLGNADPTDQHFALVAYNFQSLTPPAAAPVDFDGDRKTDISIFRPAGGEWWINRSSDNQTNALQFGTSSDRLVPADYTGDGKTDVAIWRPSEGQLYVLRSEDSSFYAFPFGISTDIFVPGDYDGDNKADAAVFRQSASTWYIAKSGGGTDIIQFGIPTDIPIPADYDGDGKSDIAIFRPSGGEWWINKSTGGVTALQFGLSTDKLVPGDYTGDGKADIALWRPSNGSWYVLRSEDSSFYSVPFGSSGDAPVPGDYDGDGKFDRGIFRPSTATWYVDRTTAGILITNFGLSSDTPLPNAFVR